jgi:rod shape-determining protein MreC
VKKRASARKEQSRFASLRLLLLAGTLLVVSVLLLASLVGERFGAIHQLTLDLVGPLQGVMSRSMSSVVSFKNDYLALWSIRDENKKLQGLVDKYLKELSEYREGYRTYLYLQEQLKFKEQLEFQPLMARVVGKDPSFWFQTIVVDRGKKDDVVEGMVVLTPEGVVGQVVHTSDHYAKVLLANAPSSAIDALVQKNRARGILKGDGEKGYTLQYVLKNADVSVGDHIVTAGIGGVFSSGIPLGQVSAVHKQQRGMFQEIEVTPSVDFQKLEYVFIDPTDRKKILSEMNLSSER